MLLIEKLRREWGGSKARLARESGLNVTTVSLVTNGRLVPGIGQLETLASVLGHAGDVCELLEEVSDDAGDAACDSSH